LRVERGPHGDFGQLPLQLADGLLGLGTHAYPRNAGRALLEPLGRRVRAVVSGWTVHDEDVLPVDLTRIDPWHVLRVDPLLDLTLDLLAHLLERLGRESLGRQGGATTIVLDAQDDVTSVVIEQIIGERADRLDDCRLGVLVPAGLELELQRLDASVLEQGLGGLERRGHAASLPDGRGADHEAHATEAVPTPTANPAAIAMRSACASPV